MISGFLGSSMNWLRGFCLVVRVTVCREGMQTRRPHSGAYLWTGAGLLPGFRSSLVSVQVRLG